MGHGWADETSVHHVVVCVYLFSCQALEWAMEVNETITKVELWVKLEDQLSDERRQAQWLWGKFFRLVDNDICLCQSCDM